MRRWTSVAIRVAGASAVDRPSRGCAALLIETRAAHSLRPPAHSACRPCSVWFTPRRRCERGFARGDRQGTRFQTAANAAAAAVRGAAVSDARAGTPKQALTSPAACRCLFILAMRPANRGHPQLRLDAAPTSPTESHQLEAHADCAFGAILQAHWPSRRCASMLFSLFFFQA